MAVLDMLKSNGEGEAVVEYLDAEIMVVRPGRFVRCAVTGRKIPLQALKYWNVDRQEAYVDAAAAMIGFGYSPRGAAAPETGEQE